MLRGFDTHSHVVVDCNLCRRGGGDTDPSTRFLFESLGDIIHVEVKRMEFLNGSRGGRRCENRRTVIMSWSWISEQRQRETK